MQTPKFNINNRSVFAMGAITLYGFSFLAMLIVFFFAKPHFSDLVFRGSPLIWQLVHGTIFGLCAFFIINVYLKSNHLGDLTKMVEELAGKLNYTQIFFISFAAGFGEELLFRVALQHFFGIWPTAFFFVLIHGYLNLNDWRIFSYGIVMVIISAGFGYLYYHYGIAASMMAHFLIDFIILMVLKRKALEFEKLRKEVRFRKNK